jgi:signal transduction histidine kinase
LAVLVGTVVAIVIAFESYLEISTFERSVESDRLNAAATTAQAVADDLELRDGLTDTVQIHAVLHEFLAATPTLRDIAALRKQDDGLALIARTSSAPSEDVLAAARRATDRRELTWTGEGRERIVAAPVMQQGQIVGAVTVSVSIAPVAQLAARGRQVTLWFAVPAILLLTVLVDLLVRRFVHKPISVIRQTMQRAATGMVSARAAVERRDEIGEVAEGLNQMLEQLEHFHTELQTRVNEATGELQETNARLVDSYQRMYGLREALARAEQMAVLGQMAANVAHQIGTPLNLISGYVQMMKEEAQANPSALQRLQTVEAQIRKVTEAIRAMLDSARRPVLQRQPVNMASLVEQVCEVSRPALHAAQVELRIDVQESLPSLMADPVQLELALFNLVSNSLDAMPEGGWLAISASKTTEGIRLVIADSGTGIPPDVLPRVFEPWVTTKPAGRGTGLGLSITRDTIVSHGGTIDVRSEPGHGTAFTIDLPVTPTAAPLVSPLLNQRSARL